MQLTTSTVNNNPTCFFLTLPPSAIANQESLSGLETEMRKLEGIVKEIVDEMGYLQKREERFTGTNSTSEQPHVSLLHFFIPIRFSINKPTRPELCMVFTSVTRRIGHMADSPPPRILQAEIPHRLRSGSEVPGLSSALQSRRWKSLMYRVMLTGNLGFLNPVAP
jgi:hypothetical protein